MRRVIQIINTELWSVETAEWRHVSMTRPPPPPDNTTVSETTDKALTLLVKLDLIQPTIQPAVPIIVPPPSQSAVS